MGFVSLTDGEDRNGGIPSCQLETEPFGHKRGVLTEVE